MAKVKVTLVKSGIGRPKNQKATLEALGLKKLNATRVIDMNPVTRGMIDVVNHLVKVENQD